MAYLDKMKEVEKLIRAGGPILCQCDEARDEDDERLAQHVFDLRTPSLHLMSRM